MTYNGKLMIQQRSYEKECRICGTRFVSPQKNACYCSFICKKEGKAILSRWRQKKRKWKEFTELIEGGKA